MSEDMEVNLSRLVARAGAQLQQKNAKEAAARKAAEKAKDPVMQLQQAEMKIKSAEVQRKAAKDQAEVQIDKEKLELEKTKVKLNAQEKGVKLQVDKRKEENKNEMEIFKTVENNKRKQ